MQVPAAAVTVGAPSSATGGEEQRHAAMTTTTAGDEPPADDRLQTGRPLGVPAASGDDGSLVPKPESESNPAVGRVIRSAASSSASHDERRWTRRSSALKTSQSAAAAAAAGERHRASVCITDVAGSRSSKRSISRQFCKQASTWPRQLSETERESGQHFTTQQPTSSGSSKHTRISNESV